MVQKSLIIGNNWFKKFKKYFLTYNIQFKLKTPENLDQGKLNPEKISIIKSNHFDYRQ